MVPHTGEGFWPPASCPFPPPPFQQDLGHQEPTRPPQAPPELAALPHTPRLSFLTKEEGGAARGPPDLTSLPSQARVPGGGPRGRGRPPPADRGAPAGEWQPPSRAPPRGRARTSQNLLLTRESAHQRQLLALTCGPGLALISSSANIPLIGRWGNRGTAGCRHLPELTALTGEARVQTQAHGRARGSNWPTQEAGARTGETVPQGPTVGYGTAPAPRTQRPAPDTSAQGPQPTSRTGPAGSPDANH